MATPISQSEGSGDTASPSQPNDWSSVSSTTLSSRQGLNSASTSATVNVGSTTMVRNPTRQSEGSGHTVSPSQPNDWSSSSSATSSSIWGGHSASSRVTSASASIPSVSTISLVLSRGTISPWQVFDDYSSGAASRASGISPQQAADDSQASTSHEGNLERSIDQQQQSYSGLPSTT